jgi:D-3-phosphoglycerate dehydrogenase
MSRARILVADSIAEAGLDVLREADRFEVDVRTGMDPETLAAELGGYDALVVRSATKVTAAALAEPGRLKVIGRAGTGVDNIDLDAATRAGVVVVNTPGGNSAAAAELTLSLLMASARNIPRANEAIRAGRWERKQHVGIEVGGKVLGIVGLGRIGREVARRAAGLRMKLLGYDPFVSPAAVEDLGITCVPLDDLLAGSDFVTLHLPLGAETRGLVNASTLSKMKAGARLVNCARGGLVDESALLAALESGRLAGAALDVFQEEPPRDRRLVEHPHVVATPHLGASTREAQERVGTEVAAKIREFLESGTILDAVNFPSISREEHAVLRPVMDLAERLGSMLAQVAEGGMRSLEVRCYGEFTSRPLKPVMMAAMKGLLSPVLAEAVSYVNALARAGERGIRVEEGRSNEATPFAGLLRLVLSTETGQTAMCGTLYTAQRPRLVEVDGVRLECEPRGHLLFFRNRDVPGVVGRVGTLLGEAGVNIAGIQLGRASGDGQAVSIVNMDGPLPGSVLDRIRALPEILMARAVKL